jgi:hypothetical protein
MATQKQRDEFRTMLEDYLVENAARVRQLLDEGAARARDEALAAETAARIRQNEEWYGKPEPPPAPRRAIATKAFTHGDLDVKVGDIYTTDDLVVAQVNNAFVLMED